MKSGWRTAALGDVSSFLNRGISPKYLDTGGICVLNQRCVRDHRVSFDLSRRHDARAKRIEKERFVQAGDVLVNSTGTGTLGRVAQLREDPPEPTTVDSHVTIVRPAPGKFYPEFFGYMLMVIEDAITQAGEGCGGQTELARSALAEKFQIHFPESIAEQQRIVRILDKAFEGVATTKANAEKNLQNARALFESHLQSVFAHRGNGWAERTLQEVCTIGDGNHSSNYPKKADLVEVGVPFIRATNLVSGRISGDEMRYLSRQKHLQLKKGHLKTGDILITNRGEIGKTAIVDSTYNNANLNSQIAWLRCNAEIDNRFLSHVLNSEEIQRHFQSSKSGAALQQFTIKQLKALCVPLPPKEAQVRLVAKLDAVAVETHRLESIYQQKLAALKELKKSLLHEAFSGRL
jgi:type I restriction enzyme S subunit